MNLQLDDDLRRQLEAIAGKQGRDTDDLVQEVLREYVNAEAARQEFITRTRRHIREHDWLLNELAKR